jgi:NAD+ kinase
LKTKIKSLRTIGLIGNSEKPASRDALLQAAQLIQKAGRNIAADAETERWADLGCAAFATIAALGRACGLLLVFGGDGTMLRVVSELRGLNTPILGINLGRLGFLAAVSSHDLPGALEKIWKNEFTLETRPLIQAMGKCNGKSRQMTAFNDIVISHGAVSRVIELDVSVDEQPMTRYLGDGLIVSSPTGSTAYSLSAGGPIISPDAMVFGITPICAHAVSNRSVIVSSRSTIRVKLLSRQLETIIAADGQMQGNLGADDVITIQRSRRSAQLLHLGDSSFFSAVRKKLHWSGSSV